MAHTKVHKVLGEFKRGTLHSGSPKGPKVTSRKQAIAIALSEARAAGEDVASRRRRKKANVGGLATPDTRERRRGQRGGKLSNEELVRLAGGVPQLGSAIGIRRGEIPGQLSPALEEAFRDLTPEQLANIDRFAQGAIFTRGVPGGLVGRAASLPVGAGLAALNELSKAVPGAQTAISRILGEQEFREVPGMTSRANLGNVLSFIGGQLREVAPESARPGVRVGVRGPSGASIPRGRHGGRVYGQLGGGVGTFFDLRTPEGRAAREQQQAAQRRQDTQRQAAQQQPAAGGGGGGLKLTASQLKELQGLGFTGTAKTTFAPGTTFESLKKAVTGAAAKQTTPGGGAPGAGVPGTGGAGVGGGGALPGVGTAGGTFGQAQRGAQQLGQFAPGGAAEQAALGGFQPLTGQARTTQQALLTTGLPTDVAPLTQAAQIRAQQEFGGLSDVLGERFAALGLGSSSAREAALARERARLAGGISATGLEAGVQAAEAATGRRVGAVGQELGAAGLQLGGLQGAGELALGRSGQQLAGLQGAVSGLTGLTNIAEQGRQFGVTSAQQQQQFQAQLQQQANLANQQAQLQAALANQSFGGVGGTSGGGTSGAGAIVNPFQISGQSFGAHGGRVSSPDFFSTTAFGRLFEGLPGIRVPQLERPRVSSGARREVPSSREALALRGVPRGEPTQAERSRMALENALARLQIEQLQKTRPGGRASRQGETDIEGVRRFLTQAGTGVVPIGLQDPAALRSTLRFFGPELIQQGLMQSGRLVSGSAGTRGFGAGLPRNIQDPNVRTALRTQFGQRGGVPQPPLPSEMGVAFPSLVDPRRQFFDGGGEVPGIDDGTDRVPAMLRSEELVVTPDLVDAIEAANPEMPQPALIRDLQGLAMRPLDFSPEEGEFVAQRGGLSPEAARRFEQRFGFAPERGPQPVSPREAILGLIAALPETLEERERRRISIPSEVLEFNAPVTVEEALGLAPETTGPSFEGVPGGVLGGLEFAPPRRGTVEISTGELRQPGFGGQITPRGRGRGAFTAFETTVPSAQPVSPDERRFEALAAAQRRRDLIQSSLATDPVGSPEKQARMFNALAAANEQVNSLVAEIDATERRKIAEAQVEVAGAQALANLSEATSNQLRAQATKQTADAATAKVLLDATAKDPALGQLLDILNESGLGKTERGAAIAEEILNKTLQGQGVQLQENGWFRRLFGAPQFELAPAPGQETPPRTVGTAATLAPEARAALAQFLGAQ